MANVIYTVEDLYAYAYECAMRNVIAVVNEQFGFSWTYRENWCEAHKLAETMKIRFDCNGEIV
jgi:hypothetical protein